MQRGLLNTGGPTILQFPESEYVHLYLAPSWVPDAGSYFKLSSINVSLGNIYFKFCTLAVIYAWFASSTLFSPLPTNISQSMKFTLQQVFFWKCLWLYRQFLLHIKWMFVNPGVPNIDESPNFVSFFLLLWQIPNSSLIWCLQGEV